MADYVKTNDLQFVQQLSNFANKLPMYAATLGITVPQLTSALDDANFFSFIVLKLNESATFGQNWTQLKDQARKDDVPAVLPPFPVPPDIMTPPPLVNSDIEGRFRELVRIIKAHPNYTTGIGEDLGMEAPDSTDDFSTYKPEFTLQIVAGQVLLKWTKKQSDGVRIFKAIDAGQFAFIDVDLKPHYLDKSSSPPAGAVQVWKYKLVYIKNDEEIGQFSDVVEISVKGEV